MRTIVQRYNGKTTRAWFSPMARELQRLFVMMIPIPKLMFALAAALVLFLPSQAGAHPNKTDINVSQAIETHLYGDPRIDGNNIEVEVIPRNRQP